MGLSGPDNHTVLEEIPGFLETGPSLAKYKKAAEKTAAIHYFG